MPEHALDSSGSAPASRTASTPPSIRPSGPHSAIPSGHVSGQVSGQVSGRQTPMSHEARSRRNSQFKRADTGPAAAFAMTSLSSAGSATDAPPSGSGSAPSLSRRPSSGPVRSRPPSRRPSTGVFGAVAAAFTRTNSARGRTETDEVVLADVLTRLTKLFTVDAPAMRRIVSAFVDDLGAGLDRYDHTVAMIPTFVFGSPTGAEMGDFIAVDLGGTNLRVCHVSLLGQGDSPTQDDDQPKFELTQVKYRLSEDQKQESGEKLFDFCAECVMLFMHEQFDDPDSGELDLPDGMALGFTFSYPCKQDRIDHGQLIRWTKGFGASGVEGQDACQLFTSALQARVSFLSCDFSTGVHAHFSARAAPFPSLPSSTIPPVRSSPRPTWTPTPRSPLSSELSVVLRLVTEIHLIVFAGLQCGVYGDHGKHQEDEGTHPGCEGR